MQWRNRGGCFPGRHVYRGIQASLEVGTRLGHQIPPRRIRAHPPCGDRSAIARRESDQPQGSLGVFQRGRRYRSVVRTAIALPDIRRARHTIFQQYAGDAFRHEPIAHFGASRSMASIWKPRRETQRPRRRCSSRRGVHRHGGAGHVGHRPGVGVSGPGRIAHRGDAGPDRHLHMARRWLPNGRLGAGAVPD